MLNPLISTYLFLAASISELITAIISVSNESLMDNIYLAIGLFCGLASIAMFRKYK